MRWLALLALLSGCYVEPPPGILDVTVSAGGAPVACGSAASCVALLPPSNNVLLTLLALDGPVTVTDIQSTLALEEVAPPLEMDPGDVLELIGTVDDFGDQEISIVDDSETGVHVVTIQFAD